MPLNYNINNFTLLRFSRYSVYNQNIKSYFMRHNFRHIFILIFIIKTNFAFAQSVSSNVTIISSPEKTVAASAQSGANTLQVINSYGLGLASTINLSWVALALGVAITSVWDNDRGSVVGSSSTTSTTN